MGMQQNRFKSKPMIPEPSTYQGVNFIQKRFSIVIQTFVPDPSQI